VNYHISTEIKRILEIRSEKGVVNDHKHLLLFANLGNGSNIANLESWVSGSFSPDNPGGRLDALADKI
jgi:hypothetical protein